MECLRLQSLLYINYQRASLAHEHLTTKYTATQGCGPRNELDHHAQSLQTLLKYAQGAETVLRTSRKRLLPRWLEGDLLARSNDENLTETKEIGPLPDYQSNNVTYDHSYTSNNTNNLNNHLGTPGKFVRVKRRTITLYANEGTSNFPMAIPDLLCDAVAATNNNKRPMSSDVSKKSAARRESGLQAQNSSSTSIKVRCGAKGVLANSCAGSLKSSNCPKGVKNEDIQPFNRKKPEAHKHVKKSKKKTSTSIINRNNISKLCTYRSPTDDLLLLANEDGEFSEPNNAKFRFSSPASPEFDPNDEFSTLKYDSPVPIA